MATETLRVLRIITRLNIGGPAHEIASLCRHGDEHGVATVLAAGHAGTDEGDGFDRLDLGSADRVRIPGLGRAPGVAREVRAIASLIRLSRSYRPHVVHTHTSKAGLLGRLVASVTEVPMVCHTYHGHAFVGHFGAVGSSLLAASERWLARRTDAVIALGPRGRATLRRQRIGARIEVIPPGFDPARLDALRGGRRDEARASLGLMGAEPLLLVFGRLAHVKGIDTLLLAMARLGPGAADARLCLAGDGPLREALERMAARLGLAARVRFLGWRGDLAALFAAADLLVLPSRSEGFPHALVEARAAGCPVLATAVGEVPDLVVEGRTGHLVPPRCVDALADRLGCLLADRDALPALRLTTAATPMPVIGEAEFAARTFALYRALQAPGRESIRGAGEGGAA